MSLNPISSLSSNPKPPSEAPEEDLNIRALMQRLLGELHTHPPTPLPPISIPVQKVVPVLDKMTSLMAQLHGSESVDNSVWEATLARPEAAVPARLQDAPAAPLPGSAMSPDSAAYALGTYANVGGRQRGIDSKRASAAAAPLTATGFTEEATALRSVATRQQATVADFLERHGSNPAFRALQARVNALCGRRAINPCITLYELLFFDLYRNMDAVLSESRDKELLLHEYGGLCLRGLMSLSLAHNAALSAFDKTMFPAPALQYEEVQGGGKGPLMSPRYAEQMLDLCLAKVKAVVLREGRDFQRIEEGLVLIRDIFHYPEFALFLHGNCLSELAPLFEGVGELTKKSLKVVGEELSHYALFLHRAVSGGHAQGLWFSTEVFLDFHCFLHTISKPGMKFAVVERHRKALEELLQAKLYIPATSCSLLYKQFSNGKLSAGKVVAKVGFPIKVAVDKLPAALYIINSQGGLYGAFLKDLLTALENNYLNVRYPRQVTPLEYMFNRFHLNLGRALQYDLNPSQLTAQMAPLEDPFHSQPVSEVGLPHVPQEIHALFTKMKGQIKPQFWTRLVTMKDIGLKPLVIPLLESERAKFARWDQELDHEVRVLYKRHMGAVLAHLKTLPKEELRLHRKAYIDFIKEAFFRESLPFMLLHLVAQDALSIIAGELKSTVVAAEEYLLPPQAVADYAAALEIEEFFDSLEPEIPVAAPAPPALPPASPQPLLPAKKALPTKATTPAAESKGSHRGPAASPAAPAAPPLPKSGDNRAKYAAKLRALGWVIEPPTSGSHHTAISPEGAQVTLPMGGNRKEFGPKAAARVKSTFEDQGLLG